MEVLLTPAEKYTAHVIIIGGSVGLPGTDDPLKVKYYQLFYLFFFNNDLLNE